MLFEDLEKIVKAATVVPDTVQEQSHTSEDPSDLVTKLAASLDLPDAGNSKLGVAKLLVAIDILSTE